MPIPKITCLQVWWRWKLCDVVGLFFLQRPWEHGIMNSIKYQENLYMGAPTRKLKLGQRWIFQQNNDQKRMSKLTQKWLIKNKIKLLPWGGAEVNLERFCSEEWSQFPFSAFYTLIRCYSRRLFYWQMEVVQRIKYNNCGTHGFVKNNYFLINVLLSEKKQPLIN